jgi:hypothetical protein
MQSTQTANEQANYSIPTSERREMPPTLTLDAQTAN